MSQRPADEQVQEVVDLIVNRTLGDRRFAAQSRRDEMPRTPQMGETHEQSDQQHAAVPFKDWAAI